MELDDLPPNIEVWIEERETAGYCCHLGLPNAIGVQAWGETRSAALAAAWDVFTRPAEAGQGGE